MSQAKTLGLLSQSVLRSLAVAVASGMQPIQWWGTHISPLERKVRHTVLHELAGVLAKDMQGVSPFAQNLHIDKNNYPDEFESVLFDFLMPMHQALIESKSWD